MCKSGWSIFEIGNWFKLGVKPVGASDYYIKVKLDNGLGMSYLPINEIDPLPISFGKWQKDFLFRPTLILQRSKCVKHSQYNIGENTKDSNKK